MREGKKLPSDKVFVKEFQDYFETEVKKAADKVKTPKAKAAKLNKSIVRAFKSIFIPDQPLLYNK